MKRVRIKLDYVVQLPDAFDTTRLSAPASLADLGLRGHLLEGEDAEIEAGAELGLTFYSLRPRKGGQ